MEPVSFLSLVAKDLLEKFGTNLKDVMVVFPNKRASLFLNQELAKLHNGPLWTPQYTNMTDLFLSLTHLNRAESLESVCILYFIYRDVMKEHEVQTLDQFWGWGEQLLADFDDMDKHLADVKMLLTNIFELQELTDFSFLSEEQVNALKQFFKHFESQDDSIVRERFLMWWKKLYLIYQRLHEQMLKEDILYEGALFRKVIEDLKGSVNQEEQLSKLPSHIAFVGFSVLNSVEEELMHILKNHQKALFYWDYDLFYVNNPSHEAGVFMRKNLQQFGCELPEREFDNLSQLHDVTFVSTNFDTIQAKYATNWLQKNIDPIAYRNAIVLCDESMLSYLLHALPVDDEGKAIHTMNATMGFPLKETPIYSFINALVQLQTEGYDTQHNRFRASFLRKVEKHPYYSKCESQHIQALAISSSEELLQYLITLIQDIGKTYANIERPSIFEQLYIEAIFQSYKVLQQLRQLILRMEKPLCLEQITLRRLLRNLLGKINIPFHGEPAIGIQVMGVLETRCLDFSHILLLNIEEGKLPKDIHENSFIPASLREAFGLSTIRHKIAIYSYYFYRLIQRTSHLTCVYNENCSGITRHEMSRFLRQLQAETEIPIRYYQLSAKPSVSKSLPISINKTDEMIMRLRERYDLSYDNKSSFGRKLLSPTAINTYLNCSLQFYYKYVAKIRAEEDPTDKKVGALLGSIFHDTAECIYQQLINTHHTHVISQDMLAPFAQHPQRIAPYLDIFFFVYLLEPIENDKARADKVAELLQSKEKIQNQYEGEQLIYHHVILNYLSNLFRYDLAHAPFTLIGMETDSILKVSIEVDNMKYTIPVGGRVDRIDKMDGRIRIVDYKTGNHVHKEPKNIQEIFTPSEKRNGYYLQALLYSLTYLKEQSPAERISPALFYLSKSYNTKQYQPMLKIGSQQIDDFSLYAEDYMELLRETLVELFDKNRPFSSTPVGKECTYCPYSDLCR